MDLSNIKKRALKLKDSVKKAGESAVEYSAGKLADSKMTLKTVTELDALIKKSANKTKILEFGDSKEFSHRSGVIFIDTKSGFFSKMLVSFPILKTKAYSQNMIIKLMESEGIKGNLKKYSVKELPAFVVFENEKVYKVIQGEENIQKVVKAASLDINKAMEMM